VRPETLPARREDAHVAARAPNELQAAATLAGRGIAAGVARIEEFHHAVAGRAFGAIGPMGTPARVIHDGVSRGVYAGLRIGMQGIGTGAGALITASGGAGDALTRTPPGRLAVSTLNGFLGDLLDREQSDLRVEMSVRMGGQPVEPSCKALARTFPQATAKLAVFLHGLMENEDSWRLGRDPDGAPRRPYGSRLREDTGSSPIYVRYNSGLHVSENGALLSQLLEQLVDAWPVEVSEIALVGHSMGGLVARSASHAAEGSGAAWPRKVKQVVYLGSPHLGAPLERGVHRLSHLLSRLGETAPIANVLKVRSAGIKDLRYGYLLDDDWRDLDADDLLPDNRHDVDLLDCADHYHVWATLTRNPDHPLGRAVGDLLVQRHSAQGGTGTERRIPFPLEGGRHLAPATHFHLLNHPLVYEHLREWLGGQPASGPADRPLLPPAGG
jgi:pimeloyl-ACP methyl ester carboxylesterase